MLRKCCRRELPSFRKASIQRKQRLTKWKNPSSIRSEPPSALDGWGLCFFLHFYAACDRHKIWEHLTSAARKPTLKQADISVFSSKSCRPAQKQSGTGKVKVFHPKGVFHWQKPRRVFAAERHILNRRDVTKRVVRVFVVSSFIVCREGWFHERRSKRETPSHH